jgi:hypothetical protein
MITAWTKNCKTDEDRASLEASILGSRIALNRLRDLMKEDEEGLNNREVNSKTYDLPNWEHRQADANGYRRCLREYQKLLNLDQEDINARKFVRPEQPITTVGPN